MTKSSPRRTTMPRHSAASQSAMQDQGSRTTALPASIQTIVLTGFMGAGKTTVGRLLAARLHWTFLDLDAEIEREAGITIPEIFRIHGEPDFRAREARALAALVTGPRTVLALGGGAIESEDTRSLLASTPGVCTVFLSAPIEALIDRCLAQQQGAEELRPVLADRQRLHSRWSARLPHYRQAHLHIDTENLSPEQAAGNIADSVAHLLITDTGS